MVSRHTSLFRFGIGIIMLAVTTACSPMTLMETLFVSNPVLSAMQAVADCPVSKPQFFQSTNKYVEGHNWGNDERTLFTNLWPESTVIFKPGGPGEIGADGSLSMKWPWYRYNIKGQVIIEGRRLDAFAPPLRSIVGCCYGNNTASPDCCYGNTGFIASALIFPSAGCWEVTGRVGDHRLTFVTLVLRLNK